MSDLVNVNVRHFLGKHFLVLYRYIQCYTTILASPQLVMVRLIQLRFSTWVHIIERAVEWSLRVAICATPLSIRGVQACD